MGKWCINGYYQCIYAILGPVIFGPDDIFANMRRKAYCLLWFACNVRFRTLAIRRASRGSWNILMMMRLAAKCYKCFGKKDMRNTFHTNYLVNGQMCLIQYSRIQGFYLGFDKPRPSQTPHSTTGVGSSLASEFLMACIFRSRNQFLHQDFYFPKQSFWENLIDWQDGSRERFHLYCSPHNDDIKVTTSKSISHRETS